MFRITRFIALGAMAMLSACATSGVVPLKVHEISSLASLEKNTGSFQGLEFLADPIPGRLKNRVNVFYLHGIGWTENPDDDALAGDFLGGIAQAYGRTVEGQIVKSTCGDTKKDQNKAAAQTQHIFITTPEPKYYDSALPGSKLKLDELVCMDKQVLDIDETLEFVVYRIFWDDIFWNKLQFPHVGQDDAQGSSRPFAKLRRKYNRRLKDELVNYGFSDAVMYLGPAGAEIRNAVRGAMCSAALDAAGFSFQQQSHAVNYEQACRLASNTSIQTNQFAFIAESLGSKITFDVLREALTDNQDTIHDEMIKGSEIYMLANQLALLSLSDLSETGTAIAPPAPPSLRPKIIAMSELNDFLTYEIIPFMEQLWKRSARTGQKAHFNDLAVREQISRDLGFNIVDMRMEFADKLIPILKGFVDPLQAHGGHEREPELMLYILCGAETGNRRSDKCLALDKQFITKDKTP